MPKIDPFLLCLLLHFYEFHASTCCTVRSIKIPNFVLHKLSLVRNSQLKVLSHAFLSYSSMYFLRMVFESRSAFTPRQCVCSRCHSPLRWVFSITLFSFHSGYIKVLFQICGSHVMGVKFNRFIQLSYDTIEIILTVLLSKVSK